MSVTFHLKAVVTRFAKKPLADIYRNYIFTSTTITYYEYYSPPGGFTLKGESFKETLPNGGDLSKRKLFRRGN